MLTRTPGSHGDLATPARELLLALLTRLSQLGYSLHTSLLSSPGNDKDSLILRKTPRTVGTGRDFFAVCFYKSDRMKVIDCPDETVKEAISAAIKVGQWFHPPLALAQGGVVPYLNPRSGLKASSQQRTKARNQITSVGSSRELPGRQSQATATPSPPRELCSVRSSRKSSAWGGSWWGVSR